MFERVATQQGWSIEVWSTQLAGLLLGDALAAVRLGRLREL